MRVRANSVYFATGGKENDLKVWDAQTGAATFRAKNVPHDDLDMRVPVWITDFAWIDDSAGAAARTIVTCTAYNHVRVYDARDGQRRPVRSAWYSKETE